MHPSPIPVARRGGTRTPHVPRPVVAPAPPGTTQQRLVDAHPPGLPRVYVPRTRLWQRLDDAVEGSVTLVVAPAGAGKTLGVAGWLRHTASTRADHATWIHADDSWTGERLSGVLTGPARPSSTEPTLVVVDDAHRLPAAALRCIDERLSAAPESLRVLLLSRWTLPLTRLVPELLGDRKSVV